MILQTKDLGLAVQATAASPPVKTQATQKSMLTLKTKDLEKCDPENKGVMDFDPENKGLRTGRPGNRGFAALEHSGYSKKYVDAEY